MKIPKIYRNSIVSSMQNMYIFLFTIGIYFVYIPWNLERLNLVETDLGLWLFIFGILNLLSSQHYLLLESFMASMDFYGLPGIQ